MSIPGYLCMSPDTEMQTEIPLYAEEIIISKRKVMVGKVVILSQKSSMNDISRFSNFDL